jgi:hypothetical protein
MTKVDNNVPPTGHDPESYIEQLEQDIENCKDKKEKKRLIQELETLMSLNGSARKRKR